MEQMRVADYISHFIYGSLGVKEVFIVTGGGAMFLNDAIAKHEHLKAVINHHEQACAMGAVAYSKYKNSFGVVMTTSGCGATNTITGLLDAWQDNVPVLFISGQAKKKETVHNSVLPLRQLGVQEADIISIVQSITKYSVMIVEPQEIAYHLEKAAYLAMAGRPGPTWIDVPQDIQGAIINVDTLRHFNPSELVTDYKENVTTDEITKVMELLNNAKRPIIIAGNGIRLGNALTEFKNFINRFQIPVVVSYLGIDLLSSFYSLYVGRLGIKGDRAGNFAVQNADLVIALGTRLAVALTGFEYDMFAREALKVVVDIDIQEHRKNTVKIDCFINSDIKNFFNAMNNQDIEAVPMKSWIEKCRHWRDKWPVALKEYEQYNAKINLYTFVDCLSHNLDDDSVVVADAGSAYYVTAQTLKIKSNQRYITSGAQADMGFTLPATIGVCFAKKGQVVGITGDGSFQMNIQELQTIVHYKLPIKLFIWNNDGYLSIRASQRKFFNGKYIGTDSQSGISFPEIKKIAKAYGIKYFKINKSSQLDDIIEEILSCKEPVLCEVMCIRDQEIIPTVSSFKKEDGKMVSKPLEDMYPFLDRQEFLKEMIVEPLKE